MDRSVPSWGLIIQGPRFSSGTKGVNADVPDSPVVVESGFDTLTYVSRNLDYARAFFDFAVVSHWCGDTFPLDPGKSWVQLLENVPPKADWDNRRKQVVSTLAGARYLSELGATHVLKIRSDQLFSKEFFSWVTTVWSSSKDEKSLLVSDTIESEPFYLGDFIWAGHTTKILDYLGAIDAFGPHNLHPVITIDHSLKFLSRRPEFNDIFSSRVSLDWQILSPSNLTLRKSWAELAQGEVSVMPRHFLSEIEWRGKPMTKVINVENFNSGAFSSPQLGIKGPKAYLLALWKFAQQRYRYRRTMPKSRKFL